MNIDLCKPLELPNKFVNRLKAIGNSCIDEQYSESLIEQCSVYSLVRDIDQYCRSNRIIGIHYTRAMPESIRSQGLLVRDGETIRDTFLNEHGHLFTQKEILEIKNRWKSYFNHNQSSIRNNRIFFNFTESALGGEGTKHLLGLYGGEQVSMCFELDDPIGLKLGKIGVPIVVRCSLNPNQVKTFTEYPWGKILVSSFHKLINPNACGIDQDGYQIIPVISKDIIEIRILKN